MKHLFKKLHIGSNHEPTRTSTNDTSPSTSCATDHQRTMSGNSPTSPSTTMTSTSPVTTTTVPVSSTMGFGTPSPTAVAENRASDYMLSEEEFQVQLALAISASNSEVPEKDQIRAATLLSLGSNHRMDLGLGRDKGDVAGEVLARQYWVIYLFLVSSVLVCHNSCGLNWNFGELNWSE